MKKTTGMLLLAIIAALSINACASTAAKNAQQRKVPGKFPEFVKSAIINQPKETIIGVGVAKLGNLSQSMTVSATRARADISRQLNTLMKDMITDYQASSEIDPSSVISYQETITVALSKSTLNGASVIGQDEDNEGRIWTVVSISKTQAVEEINQAAAAAKLAAPKMAAFNASARMDKAFSKLTAEEILAVED